MTRTTTRLAEARHKAGLTQDQLAAKLGTVQPVIAGWETGARQPNVDNALKLARALDTTVEQLWGQPPNWGISPIDGGKQDPQEQEGVAD